MRIDVHAHYLPPEYVEILARHGRRDQAAIGQQGTPAERIDMLDAAGVDLQVLSRGQRSSTRPGAW